MQWLEFQGEGHALTAIGDEPGDFEVACGREVTGLYETNIKATPELHARPFAADTCRDCHMRVKAWASDPDSAPDFVKTAEKPRGEPRGTMRAADRRAAISGQGEAKEEAPVTRERPPAPEDDDLVFPDEPKGGPVTSGGAIVVTPEKKPRRKRDADIDSD